MAIEDAEHYTPEQCQEIRNSYPKHERAARCDGIPKLGSGAIYPYEREFLEIDPVPLSDSWYVIGGMDFGFACPTAAVKLVWDKDNDIDYIVAEHAEAEKLPFEHARILKGWGHLEFAWPHDGFIRDKQTGKPLAQSYRDEDLNMTGVHATFEDGKTGVEAGLIDLNQRMALGKFKVFSTCNKWFAEQQTYHREDGLVVKEHDHLMDATRYAHMMRRFAVPVKKKTFEMHDYGHAGGWMGV